MIREKIDSYEVSVDSVSVGITIYGEGSKGFEYKILIPEIAKGTLALIEDIKSELTSKLTITPAEVIDPKAIFLLKEKVREEAAKIVNESMPNIDDKSRKFIVAYIINSTVGIGSIEFLMEDPNLEEIVVPQAGDAIKVYHKKYGWLTTNISVNSEDEILNYASILARRVGKQITTLNPLLDAHMVTGDRANAVLYPVSNKGNTITIRKFAREPWTIIDFIKSRTIDSETAALIWLAVQYEMNILISGGTASGKTSMLNVMMAFMPTNHRVISIEDTRELQLPDTLFWTPLTTKAAGPEGEGEVTMLDLLVNSLRMRPDRIILGEIRKGEDAEVLFEAMHTGHSVYATVHADTIQETIRRLINPPINVPSNLLEAVNLNVVMFRDRKKGIRRVSQIGEYLLTQERGEGSVKANTLYRWEPVQDRIIAHSKSVRFVEELSRHTGMDPEEIDASIREKKKLLEWMVKKDIRDLMSIGAIMNDYYTNPKAVLSKVSGK